MRKLIVTLVALGIVFAIGLASCGINRVAPGFVGIRINMIGSQKGVEDFPAQLPGLYFFNPLTTQFLEYPTSVQTAVWTHRTVEGSPTNEEITFQTRDSVKVSADISFSYCLVPTKVPAFYVKFRSDDINGFTHGYLRNVARDAFNNIGSEFTFDDLNGAKKEEFLVKVKAKVNSDVSPYGVEITQFGLVEAFRPPAEILAAINAKTKAIQDAIRVENELRQSQAEAAKVVASAKGDADAKFTRAEGEARANERLARSITPALVQWKQLEIEQTKASKWSGNLPSTMLGSGQNLLFSLK